MELVNQADGKGIQSIAVSPKLLNIGCHLPGFFLAKAVAFGAMSVSVCFALLGFGEVDIVRIGRWFFGQ